MCLDGECVVNTLKMVPSIISSLATPQVSVPPNPLPGCCTDSVLKVVADNTGLATNNDVSTVIWWFNSTTTAASIVMYKWLNGGWVSQGTISDNTYGTYGAFGYYTNSEGQNFISLQVAWANVLSVKGAGSYKFVCSWTDSIVGNGSATSYEFCLYPYSNLIVDGTIRLEYWLSGTTEDIENDQLIKDYGTLSIYNTLRVNGFFGYPERNYETENIQYNNGQYVWVEDYKKPIYTCKLLLLPEWLHTIIATDFMMADTRAITDYNSKNNGAYVTKYVMKESGYSPKYYPLQANNASVELKFSPQYNRSRKFMPTT